MYVISANIHRRHLSTEEKRDLIAKLIKAQPSTSNRQVAKATGVSHPHVAKVRKELEKAGDVETVTTSVDTKGREQPAHKSTPVRVPGISAHPHVDRGLDLYQTPEVAVRALLKVERLSDSIWEPACGPGAIVLALRAAGHRVVATDLVDYQCPQSLAGVDFLTQDRAPDGVQQIVTNPPYMHAGDFVRRALDLVPRVAMLLRLAFLESEGRTDILDVGQLARVYVFRNRLPMMHRAGWDGPTATSAIAFSWFVWDREHRGPTLLSRISWEEDSRATAPPDDDGLDIPAFLKREPAPAEASQQPADPPPPLDPAPPDDYPEVPASLRRAAPERELVRKPASTSAEVSS